MSTDSIDTNVPRMGAESGYGLEETVAPLRVSGILSLIFGVLSAAAIVGPAALFLPLLALAFGLFALRRHGEPVPAGLRAARVGVFLAILFGSWGTLVPWMKQVTLGSQAEKFARDYIELIALDEAELAMELRKTHVNRFSSTMPLKAHYALNAGSEDGIIRFRNDSINRTIRKRGPGAEWKLKTPVRVFTHYQLLQAEMIFYDPTGADSTDLYVLLEYNIDRTNGDAQWHLVRAQEHSEPIYAPQIL